MPGIRCAVFSCKNSFYTSSNQNIVFHTFPKPKDKVSEATRSEWVKRCRRRDKFNPDLGRICSVHFIESDYERDLQNELLGLPLRKKLKKTAVPTVGIDVMEATSETNSVSTNRSLKRKSNNGSELSPDLPTNSKREKLKKDNLETEGPSAAVDIVSEIHVQELNYEKEYKELLKKYHKLYSSYKILRDKLKVYEAINSFSRQSEESSSLKNVDKIYNVTCV